MTTPNCRRTNRATASSKASPATLMEEEAATPFMDSTATSVVPPPMSTTM